ncbi:Ubiquinone biosynthesis O-methyltransferase [Fulvia fulva]|uniref:Ubiquinone biosynthesis O-methyltransferase n=1 Tax=Passalora fulva TaxID=5499 RepID=A0A9Q8PCF7_PASFU|nr:Ubiquinone biosynthesis O-methyltransferase [Fulvia fulva]UJO19905.1 Ubiquinone biosynthesis O-methyltransferase [Fulvia fulva]
MQLLASIASALSSHCTALSSHCTALSSHCTVEMSTVNSRHNPQLVNGDQHDLHHGYNDDNKTAWKAMATHWEEYHSENDMDGNDMFTQCLLPVVQQLSNMPAKGANTTWCPRVLDLGAGSGIIARMMAREGAHVTGLDYSHEMMDMGRRRAAKETNLKGSITYDLIDLTDYEGMAKFMQSHDRYDIVTISTTLKSLPTLEPLAKALPLMINPEGRIVVVDLHPAFSKPAGHRGMEIYEDPKTGKQQLSTYIKVPRYLNIPPTKSEAVRGQPEPLWVFHRPFGKLIEPFFQNGLILDAMREPAFEGEPMPSQAQNYHNFQQTPMLLGFRLRLADRTAVPKATVS